MLKQIIFLYLFCNYNTIICSKVVNPNKLNEINNFLKEVDRATIAKQDEKAFSCLLKLTNASFQMIASQNAYNFSNRLNVQKNNHKELVFFYKKIYMMQKN